MTTISYLGSRYQIRSGESTLDALVRGGANVPFSCRRGSCQTCLMRAVTGEPGATAQRGLRQELVDTHHFMPCVRHPTEDLTIEAPDLSQLLLSALVSGIKRLDERVVRLSLETERVLECRPG